MRSIELALYADRLEAEAAALGARLERARSRLRQACIEREARHDLRPDTVERLHGLGLLLGDEARAAAELRALAAGEAALEELQAWVEAQIAAARAEAGAQAS